MNEPTRHPDWCARRHYCTTLPATKTLPARGEHRSEPLRLDTAYGGIIATLVASRTGRAWLEMRISVHIPEQETRARLRADLIAGEIDQAIYGAIAQADIRLALANDPTLAALVAASNQKEFIR
jgi:hypothetical protein